MFQSEVEKVIAGLDVKVSKIKNEIFVTITSKYRNELGRLMNTSRFISFFGRRTKKGMKYESMSRGYDIS